MMPIVGLFHAKYTKQEEEVEPAQKRQNKKPKNGDFEISKKENQLSDTLK